MRISSGLKVFKNMTFSRYLLALIASTLLVISLFLADWFHLPVLNSVRTKSLDILSPFLALTDSSLKDLEAGINHIEDFFYTHKQLKQLREENTQLKLWKATALSLMSENKILRDQMNVIPEQKHKFITARVISYPKNLGDHRLIIQAGTNQEVSENQIVISPSGVIGRILRVGQNASEVLLTTDQSSRIPVLIEPIHQQAILAGTHDQNLRLEHLEKKVSLQPGFNVFTSGRGGIFPPGLYLGTTTQENDQLIIKPVIDWKDLDFVQILMPEDFKVDKESHAKK